MKIRYMDGATPLPERLKDRSTHSIELSDAKYKAYTSAKYFTETGVKTAAQITALEAEQAEKQKVNSKNALRQACENYQAFPGKCNANFFSLISTVRGVAKATGIQVPPKAQACLDWLDSLWLIYNDRKEAEEFNSHDFSEAGVIPYSFDEVRAESE